MPDMEYSKLFGYKLYMSCSTGKIVVPLTACVTAANVYDPRCIIFGKNYAQVSVI
jgi:hypothetical protein